MRSSGKPIRNADADPHARLPCVPSSLCRTPSDGHVHRQNGEALSSKTYSAACGKAGSRPISLRLVLDDDLRASLLRQLLELSIDWSVCSRLVLNGGTPPSRALHANGRGRRSEAPAPTPASPAAPDGRACGRAGSSATTLPSPNTSDASAVVAFTLRTFLPPRSEGIVLALRLLEIALADDQLGSSGIPPAWPVWSECMWLMPTMSTSSGFNPPSSASCCADRLVESRRDQAVPCPARPCELAPGRPCPRAGSGRHGG